ncbi:HAD hydrolase-like protein [Egicoccus sp. AB-alg2]|uniref:HAD hydrolase-like protein n=1 Tax=Egicoccus sp. AB-alg2 TaxID=3242693 RepID=UPI00359DC84C
MTPPVCFDLDGCLVDSRAAIASCINHALVDAGLEPHDEAALHRFIGPPLLETFTSLLTSAGHDPAGATTCIDAYRSRYAEVSLTHTTAVPGIAEVLAAVATQRSVLVVTSKPREFAAPILAAVGLAGHVEEVHAPALSALEEAKAAALRRALAPFGDALDPAAVWMVGDRHHDVDAGRAVGTRTLGVTWGIGDRAELEAAGADVVVDTPADLLGHLGVPA